jgi:t-SNARE complex subunit (syntaxin)
MPTLQTCASGADCAVADVPSAIAPAKHTDAQAKARELIIIFVNFVFIVVLSFFLIL